MNRRKLITLLGGAMAAWPLSARAQQAARIRRIGLLMNLSENDLEAQRLLATLREGLAQLGWADGRNLRIDYRWARGDIGRIRTFAKELVELSPDIAKTLDVAVAAFRRRPLQNRYQVLMLDGVVLARKTGAGALRRPVLVALGLRPDGKKEIIDFRLAASESAAEWEKFLTDL